MWKQEPGHWKLEGNTQDLGNKEQESLGPGREASVLLSSLLGTEKLESRLHVHQATRVSWGCLGQWQPESLR